MIRNRNYALVLAALCSFNKKGDNVVWPSYETLMKITGLPRITVQRALKWLQTEGYIKNNGYFKLSNNRRGTKRMLLSRTTAYSTQMFLNSIMDSLVQPSTPPWTHTSESGKQPLTAMKEEGSTETLCVNQQLEGASVEQQPVGVGPEQDKRTRVSEAGVSRDPSNVDLSPVPDELFLEDDMAAWLERPFSEPWESMPSPRPYVRVVGERTGWSPERNRLAQEPALRARRISEGRLGVGCCEMSTATP
jgi:hypothetical protein